MPQAIRDAVVWWRGAAALGTGVWLLLAWGQVVYAMPASSPEFPIPKVLQANIQFWIRVFTEVDEDGGFLHDPDDLAMIYHTFTDLPVDRQDREEIVDQHRRYYTAVLDALARGKRQGLTRDEQRVLTMFQGQQAASAFRSAAEHMRFQGGVRSRFAAGVLRSMVYLPEIERIFAAEGLPKELTLLPHVESSFSNKAYSKQGAAGLWQIMPATGRRFLTVNDRVDERLDLRQASRAAAKILRENYQILGTWPLAVTAYNHGANGMKRAVEEVGTTDFGVIVQRYSGPSFGFASRNFYAEFLAAVHVARNVDRYFGSLRGFVAPPTVSTSSAAPPPPPSPLPAAALAAPPPSSTLRKYRVQRGETLTAIARRFDVAVDTLAELNNVSRHYHVQAGQVLVLPEDAAPPPAKKPQQPPPKTLVRSASKPAPPHKQVIASPSRSKAAASLARQPVTPRQRALAPPPRPAAPANAKASGKGGLKTGTTEKRVSKAPERTKGDARTSKNVKNVTGRSAPKPAPAAPKPAKASPPPQRKQRHSQRSDTRPVVAYCFGTILSTRMAWEPLRAPSPRQSGHALFVLRHDRNSPEMILPGAALLGPPPKPPAAFSQDAFSRNIG